MLKIGITGGMGSGKSHCLKYIGQNYKNVKIIELDVLAQHVRSPIIIKFSKFRFIY